MSVLNLHFMGRFGNCIFQYAFARGYCERHGLELRMDDWVGSRIFEIDHPRCAKELPRMEETMIYDGLSDVSYRSYSQSQRCADFYSIEQCQRWFRFRPVVFGRLRNALKFTGGNLVAHLRRTDFAPYGYPVISKESYLDAAETFGYDPDQMEFVSDEKPWFDRFFTGELDFLPDFYRLVRARIHFRANSSFSFWSGVIGDHEAVYSPVIDGLEGGKEHGNVPFVEGQWPRLSAHDFVTEIRIKAK
jgi:hypothetical protein